MPWQRQVADVAGELLPDGRPAYREVAVTVPRQSGKTTLILATIVHRTIAWSQVLGPQRISYSAQTGNDARQKLIEDWVPILEPRKSLLGIRQILRGMGAEAVTWDNGSRIGLLASTEDSGHGKTIDLGIKDELFADADLRRDQSLIPAMSTRPFAQMLTASTMGTADSVALNAKVEQGRGAVDAGNTADFAYFEWSAHPDDDPTSLETWQRCMPALGLTVTPEVIAHALATMKLEEFKRAFLNIATTSEDRVIPVTVWDLVNDPHVEVHAEVFGLDVNPERTGAAIVAAGSPNTPTYTASDAVKRAVELVDYRAGVGWVVDACVQLNRLHGVPIALDANGPAGSLLLDLRQADIPLIELKPQEVVRAAGGFFDSVVNQQVRIRRNLDLDNAVAGAAKRTVGDAWVWGRRTSRADISPLVAATVALEASQRDIVSVYEARDLVVL